MGRTRWGQAPRGVQPLQIVANGAGSEDGIWRGLGLSEGRSIKRGCRPRVELGTDGREVRMWRGAGRKWVMAYGADGVPAELRADGREMDMRRAAWCQWLMKEVADLTPFGFGFTC